MAVATFAVGMYENQHNYAGSGMSQEQYEQAQQQKERHQEMEDLKKFPEFKKSFNIVMSNTIGPIYAGCRINDFKSATIYIKPAWYTLTEEQRTVIMGRVVRTYFGMMGARSIKSVQNKDVHMYFVDPASEEQVAKWDDFSGPSVSK